MCLCVCLQISRCKQPIGEMVFCGNTVWAIDLRQAVVIAISPISHTVQGIVDCRNPAAISYRSPMLITSIVDGQLPPSTATTERSSPTSDLPAKPSSDAVPPIATKSLPNFPAGSLLGSKGSPTSRLSMLGSSAAGDSISLDVRSDSKDSHDADTPDSSAESRPILLEGTKRYSSERCTDLEVAGGNLWVARCTGDILLIEPNLSRQCPYLGRLECSLRVDSSKVTSRTNHKLKLCAGGQYIASHLQLEVAEDKSRVDQCAVWAVCDSQLLDQHNQHCSILRNL